MERAPPTLTAVRTRCAPGLRLELPTLARNYRVSPSGLVPIPAHRFIWSESVDQTREATDKRRELDRAGSN
eukprot:7227092-Prymnesium_polylepis.1